MLMQAHGISGAAPSQATTSKLLGDVLKTSSPSYLKLEKAASASAVPEDVIMDDTSPISNDPMMSQSSPLVTANQQTDIVSMDEISDMLS